MDVPQHRSYHTYAECSFSEVLYMNSIKVNRPVMRDTYSNFTKHMRLDKSCVRAMQIIVFCRIENSINKVVNVFQEIEVGFFMCAPCPNQPKGGLAITLIFYKTKFKVS